MVKDRAMGEKPQGQLDALDFSLKLFTSFVVKKKQKTKGRHEDLFFYVTSIQTIENIPAESLLNKKF